MRLRMITEVNETNSYRGIKEYIVELGLVGPKSRGRSRKYGAYLLPHNLMDINWDLINNPEYFDRAVIYDLTHDQIAARSIQRLKDVFVSEKEDHAELVIYVDYTYANETHYAYWGGERIPNIQGRDYTDEIIDLDSIVLLIGNKELKLPEPYATEVFSDLEYLINKNID